MDRDRSTSDILAIVRRRRWAVLTAVFAGLGLAGVASLTVPAEWRGTARIGVSATRPMEADEFAAEIEAVRTRAASEQAMASAAEATQIPGLTGADVAARTRVAVEAGPDGPAHLRIEHTSGDPDVCYRVVETIVAGFRRDVYDRPRTEQQARVERARAAATTTKSAADAAQQALAAFGAEHADLLGPLDEQRRTVQQDITTVTDEVKDLEERLRVAEANLAAEPQFHKQEVRRVDAARATALEQELSELAAKLDELLTTRRYAEDHAEVRATRARIAQVGKKKSELDANAPVETVLAENPVYAEHAKQRAESQGGLKVAKQRLQSLHRTDRELQGRIAQLPPVRAQHEKLKGTLDSAAAAHTACTAELEKAERRLAAIDGERSLQFAVVEAPAPPQTPAGPGPVLLALGGLAAGGIAGLGIAWGVDSRDRCFRETATVADFLGVPSLGAIGRIETAEATAARRADAARKSTVVAAIGVVAVGIAGWAVWAGTVSAGRPSAGRPDTTAAVDGTR